MSSRTIRLALVLSLSVLASIAHAQVPFEEGEWPQWRGPIRNGHGLDKGLVKEWPKDGAPPVVWEIDEVGVGYSSLAIKDGRIITQGDLDGVEHVICLSEKDGKVLWAVQPGPAAAELTARVAKEIEKLDTNGDGQLDDAEASGRVRNSERYDRATDGDKKKIARARAERLIAALDKNGDLSIDDSEAGSGLGRELGRIDREDRDADVKALATTRAATIIKNLDKDEDGKISKRESRGSLLDRSFKQADKKTGPDKKRDDVITRAELIEYLTEFERGRDGIATLDEISIYFETRFPGRDGILSARELRGYFGGYRNGQGDGPRGTPTIDGERVYCEGGFGDVTCFDVKTGETLWHRSLTKDLGGNRPGWGYSESPLVVGDLIVVTPGGRSGSLVGLDKATGEEKWRSKGTTQGAHYSSPIRATIAGVPQIVQLGRSSAFGVSIDGGIVLWEYRGANNGTANCCTPIAYKDHVFASSAYGTGGGLVKITKKADKQNAEEVYFEKKMSNHHGGIVQIGEHMYGFGSGGLICMEVLTGKIAWTSRSVGKGSLIYADGMLYCLGERHQMALVDATPEEYREHGRFKVKNLGRPSWAHPVVA
jgi:outer membrane protein assembly factor BamB